MKIVYLFAGIKTCERKRKGVLFGFRSGILIGNVYQPIFIAESQREMRWFLEASLTEKKGKSLK